VKTLTLDLRLEVLLDFGDVKTSCTDNIFLKKATDKQFYAFFAVVRFHTASLGVKTEKAQREQIFSALRPPAQPIGATESACPLRA
jgi:hypothetical protein